MAQVPGWDALPELTQRVARGCFTKGMRQFAAASLGWSNIQATFPETREGELRAALAELVRNTIMQGSDAGYFFTKDGCDWAVARQRNAIASPRAGLAPLNPGGPTAAEFPWAVDNPEKTEWLVGKRFDVRKIGRDHGVRSEVIDHMAAVLADPDNYGKAQTGPWRGLRCIYVLRYFRLMWNPDVDSKVSFVYFGHKEDSAYSGD
ncbi:MAG: hypothetical protein AABX89_03815 [Candidatus Thermoplasmatota archaeon]